MVKSIQVFRYENPLGIGEIRNILGNERRITNTKKDKSDPDSTIDLQCRIHRISREPFGILGHFFYRYQEKVNLYMEDEGYSIYGDHFDFLISPVHQCLIVHGAQKFREEVQRLISLVIHDGDTDGFARLILSKDNMERLRIHITDYNQNNDVEKPIFDTADSQYQGIDEFIYKSPETRCATEHRFYRQYLDHCDFLNLKMRIHLLNGIVEEPSNKRAKLSIRSNSSFTLSRHASPSQWNRFILETCRTSLGLS